MKFRYGLAAIAMAVALTSCSGFKDDRGIGDAPADQVEDRRVLVWPVPDQFMNVGAFCIGEDAVYIHTREAAPVVIANSLNCDEGGLLYDEEAITRTVDEE